MPDGPGQAAAADAEGDFVGARHGHTAPESARTPPRILAGVGVLLALVAVAMFVLWPSDAPAGADDQTQLLNGTILAIHETQCPPDLTGADASSAVGPGGTGAAPGQVCGTADVRLTSGSQSGQTINAQMPNGLGSPTVKVGDNIIVGYSPGSQVDVQYGIVDHQRGLQVWLLLAAFALAVIAFGRWRGVSALAGLAYTFAVIIFFVVPAVLGGKPPLAVAIVGCAAIVLVVLYLTHGFGRTTTVALGGTLAALVLTGLLSSLSVSAMELTGAGDDTSFLLGQTYQVDLRGLLLAGILIGSLGVLDDVTVTQAATVEELSHANPAAGARHLYAAAMRVGRAHIASVINTIVLAYAGASLPLLVLIVALDDPISETLTNQLVATELVRSVVGTLGLIAAVPITTAAAAFVAGRSHRQAAELSEPPGEPESTASH